MKKKASILKRIGVSGYNKPKRTPNHPKKSHVVVAKVGDKTKLIRFGQQGVKGAGKNPKSAKDKARKKSYYCVAQTLAEIVKLISGGVQM